MDEIKFLIGYSLAAFFSFFFILAGINNSIDGVRNLKEFFTEKTTDNQSKFSVLFEFIILIGYLFLFFFLGLAGIAIVPWSLLKLSSILEPIGLIISIVFIVWFSLGLLQEFKGKFR